jgi:hypothetical protein
MRDADPRPCVWSCSTGQVSVARFILLIHFDHEDSIILALALTVTTGDLVWFGMNSGCKS